MKFGEGALAKLGCGHVVESSPAATMENCPGCRCPMPVMEHYDVVVDTTPLLSRDATDRPPLYPDSYDG